ncbi:MAG TPA: class I SAM-dependent methyltransferase [Pyrinomonadaceae bacterium]|nr:class I SAM-dependent methyltransferase [Pyrinomonadaceae bacterium]
MKRSLKQTLSRRSVNLLRACRHFGYLTLWPLDYLSRLINNKTDFPPLHLRRYVGPLRTFEASGAEFMTYLRLLVDMRPDESILDVGCGCGLMGLYLKDYLAETGSYAGVDLHFPSVNWCSKHIASRRPNFHFTHIDVKSLAYNPKGKLSADEFTFPCDSGSFDVILFKSVFTHLRPAEVENYLKEVSRLLKADGRCLATFFLLNHEQELLAARGSGALKFTFGDEQWRYLYEHSPESACAYEESFILGLLQKHDLTLVRPGYYGSWSGRKNGLSFQDMLVIKRA